MNRLLRKSWVQVTAFALLGVVLISADNSLTAQSSAPLSAEEVSKQFMTYISALANRRYHTDIYLHFDKSGPISQKSFNEMKQVTGLLMENFAYQLNEPHFAARLTTSNEKNARVKVERDDITFPHEIVLLREDGAWKVDLVATYAAWNKLEEAQAMKRLKAIYNDDLK